MPPVEDDGAKPPYSYAILIGHGYPTRSQSTPDACSNLQVDLRKTFSFYQSSDSGWQKQHSRLHGSPGYSRILRNLKEWNSSQVALPSTRLCRHQNASLHPARDISSDATIPASDPALQEDSSEEVISTAHPSVAAARSSPLQAIRSSPPVPPPVFRREAPPPTPSRPATATVPGSRSRKRKLSIMNDSGYFSSLESSVMRPHKSEHLLTSDLDIEPPRIKAGRAEEEIARIRSSSHDISPIRCASLRETTHLLGSSPLRNEFMQMVPPPLTPAIKFKKPPKPPPSLSPNTNLRNHRKKIQQMVNSPIKHLGLADDVLPWSPAFNLQDEALVHDTLNGTPFFDIFSDHFGPSLSTPTLGSPEKRSAKRDRFSSSVLADITAVNGNTRLNTPFSRLSKAKAGKYYESPCKRTDNYTENSHEDFFSFNLFSEDALGEVDGIDLLQGFEKIGKPVKEEQSPKRVLGCGRKSVGQKG
ncbi:FOXI2 protein [Coccidioides immitis RMSCC 3703]|uniref:FOXI2 protein n=1 Tax=Coccidioides immitis RMSCC 3703 TaxID=454286 RepID=A0A0J8QL06_COCIT|nr:FOXI2 protein [Coccidioides immitis RMSCC 3703]